MDARCWAVMFSAAANAISIPPGEYVCKNETQRSAWFTRSCETGAAWLSSARAVRCWVKSRNERNPYFQLLTGRAEHSGGTASDKLEEGGDDVKSSWPLCPGLHTCYNGIIRGKQLREDKPISESMSQFRLQSATRLHEVGIASNRRSAKLR